MCVCAGLVKNIRHAKMGIFARFGIMFLVSDHYLSLPIAATQCKDIFKREELGAGLLRKSTGVFGLLSPYCLLLLHHTL